MDRAIISRTEREAKKHDIVRDLDQTFHKIDELPFDFERRRMSVIVKDEDGVVSMVTKGALEEMLSVSTYVEYKGEIKRLTDEVRQEVLAEVAQLNEQGLRVLGVSYKTDLDENDIFSVEDERDMILTGYLAFLDPPKPSAAPAIKALAEYGVTTKILTGDNEKVTQAVCEKVGLDVERDSFGKRNRYDDRPRVSTSCGNNNGLCQNYHQIKKRGSSSASRIMATRLVTWEMGSTMLHP